MIKRNKELINAIDWDKEAKGLAKKYKKIDLARELLMLRMGINVSIITSDLLNNIDLIKRK